MPVERVLVMLLPLLLVDLPRYSLGLMAMCLWDMVRDAYHYLVGHETSKTYQHCPSVSVVIAGLNEGETIGVTLESIWGAYPRMEIIVVDDGSNDDMAAVALDFARNHSGVLVLKKPRRGGKSSALNFAMPFATGEIIVCVDGDSLLSPGAIWEIVQPFCDARVGAVSGTVLARHPYTNFCTWLQAYEYLRCIFVGRMLAARIDILGVISGAFGAYRRCALERVMGWDVGPGEDGDLTLRLRKAGFRIQFTPYAQCYTNLPSNWWTLIKQRRRWEWAAITFECRKHADIGNPFSPNFRLSNLGVLLDRWIYNIFSVYSFWIYAAWLCFHLHENSGNQLFLYFVCYVLLDLMILGVILYYSTDRWRDITIGLIIPLNWIYILLMKAVSLWALSEELLTRRSFRDTFVPKHVRVTTWHW